jgi:hypothetical protein
MTGRWAVVIGAAAVGVMALGAQTAAAAPNVCVNVNGEERVSIGSVT